jgi:ABC-2 type transport system ATP-binding protein
VVPARPTGRPGSLTVPMAESADNVVVAAEGLTKTYGDLVALGPLDLSVPEGQRVVLVGHNGSGKTTLMRIAAGLLEPSGGQVKIIGSPAGSLAARAAVSYLPDNPVLYDDLSVLEHIEYVCRLHNAEDWEERAVGLLEELGLTERADDLPSRFSRGLRQKTAILLGLIRPFSVLLVDEPFVGLDPPGQTAFVDLLDDATESGATVVVATHQLAYVERADRCVALRDGAVIFDGPPGEIDVNTLVV